MGETTADRRGRTLSLSVEGGGTVRRRRGRCMHERSGRDRENRYHALVVSSLGAVQQCLGVGMPRCFCSIAFVSGFGNNLTSTASLGCL
jgi:hypothetical protein